MKSYVIADIHGRYDLLSKAVVKITEHADGNEYRFISLGDYIDRGPESKQVIAFLMEFSKASNTICLKGNHEDMMVQSCTTMTDRLSWWVGNGGDATLRSYGGEPGFTLGKNYELVLSQGVVLDEHVKWMANLPYYYETEKQLFVHAGVPQSQMKLPPKNAHHLEEMIWMLYGKDDGRGWKGKHVVHGHHQFADGPHVFNGPFGGRTDLDCWANHTGRLVIGVFDDTQGPALEFLEVTDGTRMDV